MRREKWPMKVVLGRDGKNITVGRATRHWTNNLLGCGCQSHDSSEWVWNGGTGIVDTEFWLNWMGVDISFFKLDIILWILISIVYVKFPSFFFFFFFTVISSKKKRISQIWLFIYTIHTWFDLIDGFYQAYKNMKLLIDPFLYEDIMGFMTDVKFLIIKVPILIVFL